MNNIIFYGLGRNAIDNFDKWTAEIGMPVCFVDADSAKHYSKFPGTDVEVLPLIEAINTYSEYVLYCTQVPDSLHAVKDFLLGLGVPKDRVKFCEAVEQRSGGCWKIGRHLVLAGNNSVAFCNCTGRELHLVSGGHDAVVSDYYRFSHERINNIKNGIPNKCDTCPESAPGLYPVHPKISSIQMLDAFGGDKCNFDCIYCGQVRWETDANLLNDDKAWDTLKTYLWDKQFSDVSVSYTSGEITISPYRDEILDLWLNRGINGLIASNCGIYNEKIYKILASTSTELYHSLDAGTRETFKAVRRVDAFDSIVDHLRKYAKSGGHLAVKYILCDDQNCGNEDLEGFVAICNELSKACLLRVLLSHNLANYEVGLTDREVNFIRKAIEKLTALNVNVKILQHIYSTADQNLLREQGLACYFTMD